MFSDVHLAALTACADLAEKSGPKGTNMNTGKARVVAAIGAVSALGVLAFAGTSDAPRDAIELGAGAAAQMVQDPDTTGASLWAHMRRADFKRNWSTWPGKGKLYRGREPHGALLTTYLNGLAYDALTNKAGRMPAGAIIVKENYAPDSTLVATTVMYKVADYNPDAGDWYWVKFLADGKVDRDGMAQGRVPTCIQCHGAQKSNDYVFTGSLK